MNLHVEAIANSKGHSLQATYMKEKAMVSKPSVFARIKVQNTSVIENTSVIDSSCSGFNKIVEKC